MLARPNMGDLMSFKLPLDQTLCIIVILYMYIFNICTCSVCVCVYYMYMCLHKFPEDEGSV